MYRRAEFRNEYVGPHGTGKRIEDQHIWFFERTKWKSSEKGFSDITAVIDKNTTWEVMNSPSDESAWSMRG